MRYTIKRLIYFYITGTVAISIGAMQKLNGNEHYSYALWTGIGLYMFAILLSSFKKGKRLQNCLETSSNYSIKKSSPLLFHFLI